MRGAWLLVVLLSACAAGVPTQRSGPWEPVGYKGFAESIDSLVGPDAIDCGYIDLIEVEKGDPQRKEAYACVHHVLERGVPFKFGTHRIPIDSNAYEVLARSPDGKLWEITFDRMLTDDETGQQWNNVCQSAHIDRKTLVFQGKDCVSQPDGMLKLQ